MTRRPAPAAYGPGAGALASGELTAAVVPAGWVAGEESPGGEPRGAQIAAVPAGGGAGGEGAGVRQHGAAATGRSTTPPGTGVTDAVVPGPGHRHDEHRHDDDHHLVVDDVLLVDPAVAPAAAPTIVPAGRGAQHEAAGELLGRLRAELPALAALDGPGTEPRLALVVAGWLAGFRSARTRRAYAGDLVAWSTWCDRRGLAVLGARRVQVDLHAGELLDAGAAASSVARRLSALSSFYRFAAGHDLLDPGAGGAGGNPVTGVRRPGVDPDHTATIGLSRDDARALLAAADADPGPAALRTAALVRLLLHNALRVDELAAADVTGLGTRPGPERVHRSLVVVRKGGRRTTVALAPDTTTALEAYLEARAAAAGVARTGLRGPLLATRTGGRLTQKAVWELVRRLARTAGIETWNALSPHSLRHTAITLALDAGVPVRDVQDFAGHRDPRTTRRYDHARHALERSAAYTIADWLT